MKGHEKSGFTTTGADSKSSLSLLTALVHCGVQITLSGHDLSHVGEGHCYGGIIRDKPMVISTQPKERSNLFLNLAIEIALLL